MTEKESSQNVRRCARLWQKAMTAQMSSWGPALLPRRCFADCEVFGFKVGRFDVTAGVQREARWQRFRSDGLDGTDEADGFSVF